MATATTAAVPAPPAVNRPNMVSIGTIVWLSSELMFFAALFAIYFTLRGVSDPEVWAENTDLFLIPFAVFNTTVLVLSSVTCQLGVFAAERGDVKRLRTWYVITFLMGAFFIGGQIFEYTNLVREGLTLGTTYGTAFYLTTGFHGLHVTGGLIAFLFVLGRTYASRRFSHRDATSAIVTSYYWHFVDVVWIALFTVIYIIQ